MNTDNADQNKIVSNSFASKDRNPSNCGDCQNSEESGSRDWQLKPSKFAGWGRGQAQTQPCGHSRFSARPRSRLNRHTIESIIHSFFFCENHTSPTSLLRTTFLNLPATTNHDALLTAHHPVSRKSESSTSNRLWQILPTQRSSVKTGSRLRKLPVK